MFLVYSSLKSYLDVFGLVEMVYEKNVYSYYMLLIFISNQTLGNEK